jgi:calcineurin-like phosphoesterase
MDPVNDPFGLLDQEISAHPLGKTADAIVVDFHGEASSEKLAAGYFCDGRVSLVVGTHTHIPTADHRILPLGTAYITDVGMTGDYESIIGIKKAEMLRRLTTGIPSGRFQAADGAATMCGIAVETDETTGLATHVAPIRIGGLLDQALPLFWTNG